MQIFFTRSFIIFFLTKNLLFFFFGFLQTLCEKGLSAMESSHRRTINDLEEKHKQEIERLLIEKETALAEETQVS